MVDSGKIKNSAIMTKREKWLAGGILLALIIGLTGGWVLNEKQLWFWGIKHDQAEIQKEIEKIRAKEEAIQRFLKAFDDWKAEIDELGAKRN